MNIDSFMQIYSVEIIFGVFLFIVVVIIGVMLYRGKKGNELLIRIQQRLGLEPRKIGVDGIECIKEGFRIKLTYSIKRSHRLEFMLVALILYHKERQKIHFECSDLGLIDISSLTRKTEISRLWRSTDIPGLERTGIFVYGKQRDEVIKKLENEDIKKEISNLHNLLKAHSGGFLIDGDRIIVEVDVAEEGILDNTLLELLMRISDKFKGG